MGDRDFFFDLLFDLDWNLLVINLGELVALFHILLNVSVINLDNSRLAVHRIELLDEIKHPFLQLSNPFLGEDSLESCIFLGLLKVRQSVVLKELCWSGKSGTSPLEIGDKTIFWVFVNISFLTQLWVNSINKEIDLNIELEFHGLHVPSSHGDWDILSKSTNKGLAVSFFESLQILIMVTSIISWRKASINLLLGLNPLSLHSLWKESRVVRKLFLIKYSESSPTTPSSWWEIAPRLDDF